MTVTQTLAGVDDLAGGGYDPPDVQVAAGPGYVFETVNLAGRVWRTGAAPAEEVATFSLGDFFGTGRDQLTDPRILYDALGGRWFVSISDEDAGSVLLAVSRSTDPTGDWGVYDFAAAADCADQPRMGTADGIVVLSADVFRSCNAAFAPAVGAQLWVVNKQQLLAGAASVDWSTYGPTRDYTNLTPVHSLSPTGVEYLVSVDAPGSQVVHLLTVSGIPPEQLQVQETATPAFSLLRSVRGLQPFTPGSSARPFVATNDNRVLDAVWQDGRLWFTANGGCVPAGDSTLRSCGRVAELATATGAVSWQADIGFAGSSVFFPSVRPDGAGNLVVVFGQSSATLAPQVAVVARAPDGTFTEPAVVARSAAPHVGDRFGDYFGSARDPSNPSLVWVAGETGAVDGRAGWTTTVASVVVTAAGGEPPKVVAPAPPGLRARAATARAGKAVRLSYVALGGGSGIRREVIVRDGGRVVFHVTTKPAALRAERVYSLLWRPASRLRGSFRFCVRSVGPDGTRSRESCAPLRIR